jgi:cytochrome oxidase Cu insertion factor (SCO1/SenC/PrrC family)
MAKKTNAGRMKVGLAFLLLFGPAFLLIFFSTRGCEHKFKELEDFGQAKDYSFTDIKGKKRSSKDFKGAVVLLTTIQQTCPDSCAVSFFHLNQTIYQHIYENKHKQLKKVRIISFATDGQGKPLEDLSTLDALLRDRVENYDPEIWVLAKGDAKTVYDFERNNQNLLQEGDEFYGGQAFQELMLLLDKQNHLRMVLRGDSEGMVRRMKEHIALLQKQYDKENSKK